MEGQQNPIYSIIIPHKNSFDFLLRLLTSIPDSNICEVLVIDDNSDYLTQDLLKSEKLNTNVKIFFNKEGGGAGKARNIGLDNATGKWLVFADADDYFSTDFLSILEAYIHLKYDIVYFNTTSVFNDTNKKAFRHEKYSELTKGYLDHKTTETEENLKYYFTPVWGKLIHRDLIVKHNILFDEVIASNDVFFSVKLASLVNKIFVDPRTLYTITVSKGSLTNTFSKETFDSRLNAALKVNNYLREINKHKYQQSVLYFIVKSYSFGFNYSLNVLKLLIINRSNIFIGMEKLLSLKKTIKEREGVELVKK